MVNREGGRNKLKETRDVQGRGREVLDDRSRILYTRLNTMPVRCSIGRLATLMMEEGVVVLMLGQAIQVDLRVVPPDPVDFSALFYIMGFPIL